MTDNEDVRKISAWVAIVAVPTMVAGIYGMNFDNMPETGWKYGYFVVLGVIAAIMVAALPQLQAQPLALRIRPGNLDDVPRRPVGQETRRKGGDGPAHPPRGSRTHRSGRGGRQTAAMRLRPVTVEAMTTRTAATAIAMSQRTQSMPRLPSPPNAV